MSILFLFFFFICRGNLCRFKPYLSSVFAAEIIFNSNSIFLLYLPREPKSNCSTPVPRLLIFLLHDESGYSVIAASRLLPPASAFRLSGSQSGTVRYQSIPVPDWASLFRYRAGSSICILVHSGTGMNRCRTVWRSRIKTV